MMDALTLEAVEAAVAPGYPAGAGAVLIVELDGPAVQVVEDSAAVEEICRECGAFEVRAAETAEERALVWRGRKSSFAAMGRISPSYYVQDGVVPRTKLPEVLRRIYALGDEYGLRDRERLPRRRRQPAPARALRRRRSPGQAELAERLATAILDVCIDAGGSLTGEHGVGVDKACSMPKLFGADDLATMRGCATRSTRAGSRTRARCSRRRGCAARCRGRTARTRWSGPGLPSVSEPRVRRRAAGRAEAAAVLTGGGRVSIDRDGGDVVLSTRRLEPRARARAGRPDRDRRGGHPPLRAAGARSRRTARCSRSTRRATRRSARASPATCPARGATATARCATS